MPVFMQVGLGWCSECDLFEGRLCDALLLVHASLSLCVGCEQVVPLTLWAWPVLMTPRPSA